MAIVKRIAADLISFENELDEDEFDFIFNARMFLFILSLSRGISM